MQIPKSIIQEHFKLNSISIAKICFKINSISKTMVSILRLVTIPNTDNQKARLWSARSKGKQVACTKRADGWGMGDRRDNACHVPGKLSSPVGTRVVNGRAWKGYVSRTDARTVTSSFDTLSLSLSSPVENGSRLHSPRRGNKHVQRAPSLLRAGGRSK